MKKNNKHADEILLCVSLFLFQSCLPNLNNLELATTTNHPNLK